MNAEIRDLVRRWMAFVRDDLHVAERTVAERHGSSAWVACFHSQQAAEKAIKAAIAADGATPPFTHNLVTLAAVAPSDLQLPVSDLTLGLLTTYAATVRYVMADLPDDPLPSWVDAEEALRHATTIATACRSWLATRSLTEGEADSGEVAAAPPRGEGHSSGSTSRSIRTRTRRPRSNSPMTG